MGPTRLRCLNACNHLSKNGSNVRAAAFSTTRIACADDPSRKTSATASLLAALDNPGPTPEGNPSLYSNPIRTPKRQSSFFRPPSPTPGNSTSNTRLMNLISKSNRQQERAAKAAAGSGGRGDTLEDLKKHNLATDLSKQITRRWKAGDVYAPHDLSAVEMGKWKNRSRPVHDVFDVLDFNPMDHYRNFSVMSEYMTPMGRIKHSKETGLRPVNQRRIARAIRRGIGMGMMPSVHKHPEILQKMAARAEISSPFRVKPL